jgi:hypothetical protein
MGITRQPLVGWFVSDAGCVAWAGDSGLESSKVGAVGGVESAYGRRPLGQVAERPGGANGNHRSFGGGRGEAGKQRGQTANTAGSGGW